MLIDFTYLWKKYKINAKSVLHVGASTGQEIAHYYKNGVTDTLWIEAIPEVYMQLLKNIAHYPNAGAFNACISDVNDAEVVFNIANNDGQSSSILQLGTHATVHPEVKYIKQIKLRTKRIDSLVSVVPPFVNIDLQGAELLALKGMGILLHNVKYLYLEVNRKHLYQGCPLVEELDAYLAPFGFIRIETYWAGNTGWGDAFYIRK